MAHLHPESLDHLDSRFDAEKTVFGYLKNLDDACHVFHSLTWCDDREGECDFVIFHELKGFIALEVKGGKVYCNGRDWFSTDAQGITHAIHNPVEQARASMFAVKRTWEEKYGTQMPGLFTWAVCFLDGSWGKASVTLDLKGPRVLDARGLEDVPGWADALFAECEARHGKKVLARDDAARFMEILGVSLNVPLSLNRAIVLQEEALGEANRLQEFLLDLFDDKPLIAFQGAAGTGKTWVAMKKARRLAAEGKSTLVLSYNRQVNDFISSSLGGEDGIKVSTYHAFANGIIREFLGEHLLEEGCRNCFFSCIGEMVRSAPGREQKVKEERPGKEKTLEQKINGALHLLGSLPKDMSCASIVDSHGANLPAAVAEVVRYLSPDGAGDFFADRMPLAMMAACAADQSLRERHQYDALIIDEAQDFHRNWCDSLAWLFSNFSDRTCYIFYDDNQTIFTKSGELPVTGLIAAAGLEDRVFRLRENLRNTARIHDLAVERTGRGKTSRSLEIPGVAPVEYRCSGMAKSREKVGEILEELIDRHGIDRSRVVVLSNRSIEHSIFADDKKAGAFTLVATGEGARERTVRFRTIQQFKGLESDAVVLVVHNRPEDRDDQHHSKELLYVGYTRARHLLYVVEVGE